MKSISKDDSKRRDSLTATLNTEFAKLQDSHNVLLEAVAKYNADVEAFNEKLQEARGFCDDIANEIDNYISDKSDKWQEGERGEAYGAWRDEWQNVDITDIETIADPEAPDFDADILDSLPVEPEA